VKYLAALDASRQCPESLTEIGAIVAAILPPTYADIFVRGGACAVD